jgi:hypothetical protein
VLDTNRIEPRITAFFWLSSEDLDPVAVTDAIGLQPTTAYRKGETWSVGPKQLRRKTGSWSLDVRRWVYSTDAVVSELLDSLWPRRQSIVSYCLEHDLAPTMACNISIHHDRPVYDFKLPTLEKLSELRCELLLDVFDYSEDEDP